MSTLHGEVQRIVEINEQIVASSFSIGDHITSIVAVGWPSIDLVRRVQTGAVDVTSGSDKNRTDRS